MNAYERLPDTELEAMLARLTARGRADGLDAAIMAAVDTTPQQRGAWIRWPDWSLAPAPGVRLDWLLVILALMIALVAGTLAVGSRLLESSEPLPKPAPVFAWGRDDLAEWVTKDELAEELAGMSMRRPSLAPLDGAIQADCAKDDCSWTFYLVGDPYRWSLRAHSHGGVDLPWMTDPLLPEGATHARGWGHFFAGPHSKEFICITLEGGSGVRDGADFRARDFALASLVLRELGWAD